MLLTETRIRDFSVDIVAKTAEAFCFDLPQAQNNTRLLHRPDQLLVPHGPYWRSAGSHFLEVWGCRNVNLTTNLHLELWLKRVTFTSTPAKCLHAVRNLWNTYFGSFPCLKYYYIKNFSKIFFFILKWETALKIHYSILFLGHKYTVAGTDQRSVDP